MIAQGRWKIIFQSTFPRGERRGWIPDYNFDGTISIHVPTRGTTIVICIFYIVYAISIHVPTRGTTFAVRHYAIIIIISIHVPTRGTTTITGYGVPNYKFQSTFPRGERRHVYERLFHLFQISIHVPTRGTTWTGLFSNCTSIHFNPRSHEGNDRIGCWKTMESKRFQSTFPRGERQDEIPKNTHAMVISIHVPTRGTTKHEIILESVLKISIHVPTRGTTNAATRSWMSVSISIHVPTRGTTYLLMHRLHIS